jgi:hypothetical protein
MSRPRFGDLALRDNLITQPPTGFGPASIRVADTNPETGHLLACLARGRRPCFTRLPKSSCLQ